MGSVIMGGALEVCKVESIIKAGCGGQGNGEVLLGERRGCGVC